MLCLPGGSLKAVPHAALSAQHKIANQSQSVGQLADDRQGKLCRNINLSIAKDLLALFLTMDNWYMCLGHALQTKTLLTRFRTWQVCFK